MHEDVEQWVKKCQRIQVPQKPFLATRPLEVVAVDYTMLECATDGCDNVLVITDVFTKFISAFATRDQKADTTAKVILKECFLKYGVPELLHSDQGRHPITHKETRSVGGSIELVVAIYFFQF